MIYALAKATKADDRPVLFVLIGDADQSALDDLAGGCVYAEITPRNIADAAARLDGFDLSEGFGIIVTKAHNAPDDEALIRALRSATGDVPGLTLDLPSGSQRLPIDD